jgi:hypothetical protein
LIHTIAVQSSKVDQGQVSVPGVVLQLHDVVQDGHDAYQNDQDGMGSVMGHITGRWSLSGSGLLTWNIAAGT